LDLFTYIDKNEGAFDAGKMIAVSISPGETNDLLKDELEIRAVNFNSPKQTVLAGTSPGLTAITDSIISQILTSESKYRLFIINEDSLRIIIES